MTRGQSTTLRLTVNASPSSLPPVTLSFATLPLGITGTPTTWHLGDSPATTVQLAASNDAPQAELPIEIHATINGNIVARANVQLDVSDVSGSPDRSFGDNGHVLLPGDTPVGIGLANDGSLVVAGMTTSGEQPFVARVRSDGALGAKATTSSAVGVVTCVAFAPDGRVALGVIDGHMLLFDATGALASTLSFPFVAGAIAWDGDALFVASLNSLTRLIAGQTVATITTPFPIGALETIAPGVVLASGRTAPAVLGKFVATTSTIVIDPTYGAAGVASLTNDTRIVIATSTDATGLTLAALWGTTDVGATRVTADGVVDGAYGTAGIASLALGTDLRPSFVRSPNGDAFIISIVQSPNFDFGAIARFDSTGSLVGSFGTFGRAIVAVGTGAVVAAGVLDAQTRICITGTLNGASTGFVTCSLL